MEVSKNQIPHLRHLRRIMGGWISRTSAGESTQACTSKPFQPKKVLNIRMLHLHRARWIMGGWMLRSSAGDGVTVNYFERSAGHPAAHNVEFMAWVQRLIFRYFHPCRPTILRIGFRGLQSDESVQKWCMWPTQQQRKRNWVTPGRHV